MSNNIPCIRNHISNPSRAQKYHVPIPLLVLNIVSLCTWPLRGWSWFSYGGVRYCQRLYCQVYIYQRNFVHTINMLNLNVWICWLQGLNPMRWSMVPIVGTLGCVFIDNETHESGVTKCTTGEAWSAFSWHHSSVFHCQWTHNQVFLLLSHMLIWNAKSIFIYVMKFVFGFIWKLGINFAVCIKWIDETWWNNRLLMVPNCYEVVAMVATMVAMVAPLWCHTLR